MKYNRQYQRQQHLGQCGAMAQLYVNNMCICLSHYEKAFFFLLTLLYLPIVSLVFVFAFPIHFLSKEVSCTLAGGEEQEKILG